MGINSDPPTAAVAKALNGIAHDTTGINGLGNLPPPSSKPYLLICASPATGHTTPIIKIASELIQHGYEATFIAGDDFKDQVEKTGAKFVHVDSMVDPTDWPERDAIPVGITRLLFDLKQYFITPTEARTKLTYEVLENLRAEHPTREIIILTETFWMGTLAMSLGAPLPKGFTTRPKVINIHAATYLIRSDDVGPMGLAMLPDASEEGRAKHRAIYDGMINGPFGELIDFQIEVLTKLGAVVTERTLPFETWMKTSDITLQMCPPSVEYDLSDWHPNVKSIGALGARPLKKDFVFPSFWDEVTRGDKKVVTVTQGTVAVNYNHLLLPTIKCLADREDILVVAILGSKGASLPSDVELPSNARVIDHLAYDAILPHSAAFVLNGGYGGFTHGVINGVPMVLAGATEDKPDVCRRGEWAGIAVNLETGEPTEQQIAEGIKKVLEDSSFKKKLLQIQKENEDLNALETIEKTILEFAGQK